jgi:predicted NBD/HSP70 family sugar kinase
MNDRAVLDLLLDAGHLTRPDISTRTGLSKVTVSQLLGRLEARGMVTVVGNRSTGRGPGAAVYSLVASAGYGVAADVTPSATTVVLADLTGTIRGRAELPGGSPDLADDLHKGISAAAAEAGVAEADVHAVVIGTPGVVDPATGQVDLAVDIPAWSPTLTQRLRARWGCPVVLENDVNLAALAELASCSDLADFVLLWVGRGLGLAVVLDGRLHRGACGSAGEIGYLPMPGARLPSAAGDPRAAGLQSLVGGDAVRELAVAHGLDGSDPAAAIEALPPGHPVLDALGARLAIGVAAVCSVLDPGLVVLSGEVGRAGGAALAQRVAQAVSGMVPARVAVRPSVVPSDAALAGAVHVAARAARDAVFGAPV